MRAVVAVLLVSAASCAGDPARDDTRDLDAAINDAGDGALPGMTVTLGTGQSDFEPLPAHGGNDELIYGPQGGYHVWGRARIAGFAPDVDVSFTATRLPDGTVLHEEQWSHRSFTDGVSRGLVPIGGGRYETGAEIVVLAIRCADEAVAHTLEVSVSVRERATGHTATDRRTVTVVDEIPSPACVPSS